ncbi:hypothetical protein RJ639_022932, partial [Escallonia herrerae]
MVEEESLNFSEDDAYSFVEHEVITASSDGPNVQPIEGDIRRKKLVGEGFSVEGEGTVDSSINNGDGGHHAKHIHDDTPLVKPIKRNGNDRNNPTITVAWRCWQKGRCLKLIDPILKADTSSMQDIVRCIHIGLLCIQELAADRLSMFDVVLMLSGPALNFPRPLKPVYFKHGSISGELEESDSA